MTPARFGRLALPLLYSFAIFVLWSAFVAFLYPRLQQMGRGIEVPLTEAVRMGIFALPVLWLLLAEGQTRPLESLRLRAHAGRGVGWGLLLGASLVGVHAAMAWRSGHFHLKPVPIHAYFTALSLATIAEEIAFRGYLLQQFERAWGGWIALLVSAALFALIHMPGWLLVSGSAPPGGLARPLMEIFAVGLALGFVFQRTRSLWASILLHAANNLAVMLFYSGG